jgi:hypothetical protein
MNYKPWPIIDADQQIGVMKANQGVRVLEGFAIRIVLNSTSPLRYKASMTLTP